MDDLSGWYEGWCWWVVLVAVVMMVDGVAKLCLWVVSIGSMVSRIGGVVE